jgi:undecaprenyl-diphosphatase
MPEAAVNSLNYFEQLFALTRDGARQLVRPPSHSLRAQAARRLARQSMLLTGISGACVVALMILLDAREIVLMPPRGTPGLWPVRILTDFGKDTYVLWSLATALLAIALASPLLKGTARGRLLRLGTRVQYLLFAVLLSLLFAQIVKWGAGRGRPFVGGKADPFNFVPFTGTEAHFSFPSSHAVTGFALAFAVGAVWPRLRLVMFIYAVAIAGSRLVLLAHHPSDVVAGALIGILCAMAVRYWFAARQLCFSIHDDGHIVPL